MEDKAAEVKTNKCSIYRDLIALKEQPLILKIVVGAIVPFIMIYGIYVLLNGHISPGGGFSGGTILSSGLVLLSLAYGKEMVGRFFSFKTFAVACAISLGIYILLKAWSFTVGATGGSTGIPLGNPGDIISAGMILPLSIAVGIVVACTIYCFYALFSEGEL